MSSKTAWSNMSSQFLNGQKDSLTLQFWCQTIILCQEKIMEDQYIVNFKKHKYSITLRKVAHLDLHALPVTGKLPVSSSP